MELITYFELLFILLIGHALCDYSLQNDFIATAKNKNTPLGKEFWYYVLPGHGLIHGGWVYVITGSFVLGLLETVIHSVVDYLKCEKMISVNTDQIIHIGCKVLWVIILALDFEVLRQVQ